MNDLRHEGLGQLIGPSKVSLPNKVSVLRRFPPVEEERCGRLAYIKKVLGVDNRTGNGTGWDNQMAQGDAGITEK